MLSRLARKRIESHAAMPLLTVIIPTYNRSKLLSAALESVLSQEFTDYEVIVVDDGSTDDTAATVASWVERQPLGTVRALRQANAGQGAARNLAIGEARGEYCMFLDSDDRSFPWSLRTMAEVIETNGRPSVLIGKELGFSTDAEARDAAARPPEPLRVRLFPDLYTYTHENYLGPCGILVVRTELFARSGVLSPNGWSGKTPI